MTTRMATATGAAGADGGNAAASIMSSATTTASSCSRRGSAKAATPSRYIVRATTAGTFRTAPAHAEEMYEPEVFGRTASVTVEVRPVMNVRLPRWRPQVATRMARFGCGGGESAVLAAASLAAVYRWRWRGCGAGRCPTGCSMGRRCVRRSCAIATASSCTRRGQTTGRGRCDWRRTRCPITSSRRRSRPKIIASVVIPASIRLRSRARRRGTCGRARVKAVRRSRSRR